MMLYHNTFCFFFETESQLCRPVWSAVTQSQLTATSASQTRAILMPQASWVAGTTDVQYHAWLIFIFSIEMRFHHVGQDGLDLLTW